MSHKEFAVRAKARTKPFGRTGETQSVTMDRILTAFEFVFGCWHRNLSRPFTLSGWTYEVCLNCGKKFAYDRVEIGRGIPAANRADPPTALWDDDLARVWLPEMQEERMTVT